MKKHLWKYDFQEGDKVCDYYTFVKLDTERIDKKSRKYAFVKCMCCGRVVSRSIVQLRKYNPKGCILCVGEIRRKIYTEKNTQTYYSYLYRRYEKDSLKRELEFSISEEYFKSLITQPCHYCGDSFVNSCKRGNKTYTYNGIDRKDNTIGYVENNTVSCCKLCNRMKNVLSTNEFLNRIFKIYNEQVNR